MLKFVWCYMTAAFAILFAFQSIGMTVMGDYMMFVGMLCLSFVLIKDDRIKPSSQYCDEGFTLFGTLK